MPDIEYEPAPATSSSLIPDAELSEFVTCAIPRWKVGKLRFGPRRQISIRVTLDDASGATVTRDDGRPLGDLHPWCVAVIDVALNRMMQEKRKRRTTQVLNRRSDTTRIMPTRTISDRGSIAAVATAQPQQDLTDEPVTATREMDQPHTAHPVARLHLQRDVDGLPVITMADHDAREAQASELHGHRTPSSIFRIDQEETRARIRQIQRTTPPPGQRSADDAPI